MPYAALPDRRMPYDNDGTVVYRGFQGAETSGLFANFFALGPNTVLTGNERIELNDFDTEPMSDLTTQGRYSGYWFFFPELREVTAYAFLLGYAGEWHYYDDSPIIQGSNNSTNGMDGTWETATIAESFAYLDIDRDAWRTEIKTISFTGPKRVIRIAAKNHGSFSSGDIFGVHLYGEKAAGETPDDIIFIDHDTTPGAEYTADEDFGDRPLATSSVRQFRVKNASATLTANNINLQCNDSDFVISEDGVTWVVTINITSLAAGAESATLYVRNTTPAAGSALGPRYARIIGLVGSWT